MKFLLIIAFFFGSLYAYATDPAPNFVTSASLTAQGHTTSIPAGSYLRMVNFEQNYANWYHQALLVDANNNVLNPNPVNISQEYLIPQMTNTINGDLQFIDSLTGDTITGYEGQQYVITGATNTGWKTYDVHFVDPEGNQVDHKGIPAAVPREYKISQKYLDQDRGLRVLTNYNRATTAASNAGKPAHDGCAESSAPATSLRPQLRPEDLVASPEGNSYAHLTRMRGTLRAKGNRSCMNAKAKIEREYLAKHPYGKLSLHQRANQIHADANRVLNDMVRGGGAKNKSIGTSKSSRYKNWNNGAYIDPVVTPEVAACISYQETKGNLNPYAVNYTLCNSKMTSTAHGLGQMTRSTLTNMRNNKDGNLLPLNTAHSKKYAGKSSRDMHSSMSGDVNMQLEVLMRLVSSNAKFIRWKNSGLTEREVLRRAIINYDRDAQSAYMKNVFDRCLPCLEQGKSGAECYQKLK